MPSKNKPPTPDLPIVLFETQEKWSDWLDSNGATSPGVLLRIGKKNGNVKSLTFPEALDVALCHGWIDGKRNTFDDSSFIQRFTPRRPKSLWSKVNQEKVKSLIEAGRMKPAGFAAIEAAKADGRWAAAYDSPGRAMVPDDLQHELDRHPAARDFFASLNRINRYAILFRIQTAKKPETRARRIASFVEMLERKETIYP